LISVSAIKALAVDQPAVETLLETQTTNIGQAIGYPSGAAQITAVIVTLAPGEETGQSLEVRISALSTDDNQKSYVWVVDPEAQTVHRREVEVGETISRGVVVRGLERGEWVAIAGTQALRDGQKVRILERIEQESPSRWGSLPFSSSAESSPTSSWSSSASEAWPRSSPWASSRIPSSR
jgi:multidrug efflux pump subunit AcrA (membrane-fusion protein)